MPLQKMAALGLDVSMIDLWFTYAYNLSEAIYCMKLEIYENACTTLFEKAVRRQFTKHQSLDCDIDYYKDNNNSNVVEVGGGRGEKGDGGGGSGGSEDNVSKKATAMSNTVDTQSTAESVSTEDQAQIALTVHTGSDESDASGSPLTLLDMMRLSKPVRVRKYADFLDAIEEEKECTYDGLEGGYVVQDIDVDSVRKYGERNGWIRRSTNTSGGCGGINDAAAAAAGPDVAASGGGGGSPATAAVTTEEAEAVGALLYGELTSLGVRQLNHIMMSHFQRSASSLAKTNGIIGVGVDVGSGTGKALFEWSRLAAAAAAIFPPSTRGSTNTTPTARGPPTFPRGAPVSTSMLRAKVSDADFAAAGWAASGAFVNSNSNNGTTTAVTAPATTMTPTSRSALPCLRGWLGVGIEVAPTRMFVARKALSPNYLDLILMEPPCDEQQQYGSEEGGAFSSACSTPPVTALAENSPSTACVDVATTGTAMASAPSVTPSDTATARSSSGGCKVNAVVRASRRRAGIAGSVGSGGCKTRCFNRHYRGPRYNPVPATTVAAPRHDPAKRQPMACVLLHEGDALEPGLLSNDTLFRFPAYTPNAAPIAAKDNYYRLARVDRGPNPTGLEEVHLAVFCCGLGFDESFCRALCQKLEDMLKLTKEGEEQEEGTSERGRRGNHWQSVTCVLLFRHMDVETTLKDPGFPLFRCCRKWINSQPEEGVSFAQRRQQQQQRQQAEAACVLPGSGSAQSEREGGLTEKQRRACTPPNVSNDTCGEDVELREVPWWCTQEAGIKESVLWQTRLETTWMAKAPAWVLHFSF